MNTTALSHRTRRAVIVALAACAFATAACGTETASPGTTTGGLQPVTVGGDAPRDWEGSLYPRPYRSSDDPSGRPMGGETSRPGLP